MKTTEEACRVYAETAFEIAIKNCIRPAKKGERRKVQISEADSRKMYDFYCARVKNDRDTALVAIGKASRRAGAQSPVIPVAVFLVALMFVLLFAFHSLWPILGAMLAAALTLYIWYNRRRMAQKIWASRKAFKGGTDEALEKMCRILALPYYRIASLPLIGGISAAVIICIYQTIMLFI